MSHHRLSQAQHRALGALASAPATTEYPRGHLRPDQWGMDRMQCSRKTYAALVRHQLVDEAEEDGRRYAYVTVAGQQYLSAANNALRAAVRAELEHDPYALAPDEYLLLTRQMTPWADAVPRIGALSWSLTDYLLRTRLMLKEYVTYDGPGTDADIVLTAAGRAALAAAPERGGVRVVLPLVLELTPEQAAQWAEDNDVPLAQVPQDIITFVEQNTLHAPDTWTVTRTGMHGAP